MRLAAAKVLPLLLIVVPIAAYANLAHVAWPHSFAVDFHREIYPEAKEFLHGRNPFPGPTDPIGRGGNLIWPPLVGYIVAPLTLLSPGAADVIVVVFGLACFAAALWLVGVRDWRVYGAASLWGPVIGEMRVAHLTLVLCLLVAVVWRTRERVALPGLALGFAVGLKFFVWPLALWLAARRRFVEAGIAAAVAAASLLLLLPLISIAEYAHLLRRLGNTFDQDSFTPFGVLTQLDVADGAAHAVSYALAAAVLVVAWRRRSFALFVALTLLVSPIVWLDYYALTAIPLAVVAPRFTWVWLLPLLTFGIAGSSADDQTVIPSMIILGVFTVVVWFTVRREVPDAAPRTAPADASPAPAAGS